MQNDSDRPQFTVGSSPLKGNPGATGAKPGCRCAVFYCRRECLRRGHWRAASPDGIGPGLVPGAGASRGGVNKDYFHGSQIDKGHKNHHNFRLFRRVWAQRSGANSLRAISDCCGAFGLVKRVWRRPIEWVGRLCVCRISHRVAGALGFRQYAKGNARVCSLRVTATSFSRGLGDV